MAHLNGATATLRNILESRVLLRCGTGRRYPLEESAIRVVGPTEVRFITFLFRTTLMNAVEAATKRSKELGDALLRKQEG